jgi:SAM-dependent methyltransferase
MKCRHCRFPLTQVFLDLGSAPPSNAYLSQDDLRAPELHYPLRLFVCNDCWLVQTEDFARADELFREDYAYFSSTSSGWLGHASRYTRAITDRLLLDGNSFVVEIASNDGYLLRNFVALGIPCLGIEPTAGTAAAAEKLGIPVLREFFGEAVGRRLAAAGKRADLVVGNNVFAHVPDINDFSAGLAAVLAPGGTITLEFPHLMRLIEFAQFDTVYHEHFSYLSLHTATRIFRHAGLRVFDVEELSTHGGSLRIYGCHVDDVRPESAALSALMAEESRRGMQTPAPYAGFQQRAETIKDDLLSFLIAQKRAGRKLAAYGAAAKGNTLLNYAGVRPDLIPYVCDAAPSKQGRFLPGSRIPVVSPEQLRLRRPDVVLILPWTIEEEVRLQHGYIADWGGRFVTSQRMARS